MNSYQSLGDILIISFCKMTVSPLVSFFLVGGDGGGGDGVLSLSSSFAGEAATACGGDRVFCFLQVFMSVYSSRFFNSIVRLIAVRTDLSMSAVCFRNLHHANIAAHECCRLFSSTKDMYSSLVFSSGNCCMLKVKTFCTSSALGLILLRYVRCLFFSSAIVVILVSSVALLSVYLRLTDEIVRVVLIYSNIREG